MGVDTAARAGDGGGRATPVVGRWEGVVAPVRPAAAFLRPCSLWHPDPPRHGGGGPAFRLRRGNCIARVEGGCRTLAGRGRSADVRLVRPSPGNGGEHAVRSAPVQREPAALVAWWYRSGSIAVAVARRCAEAMGRADRSRTAFARPPFRSIRAARAGSRGRRGVMEYRKSPGPYRRAPAGAGARSSEHPDDAR